MSLYGLPTKLLELIATQVDTKSLNALHLTSRLFYRCTLELFADKIANKQWLLRAASLDALRAAASEPESRDRFITFRLRTHALTFWVERPDEPHWRDIWDEELKEQDDLTWKRAERDERMGPGAMMLANVLQGLQALCRIEIGEWCGAREGFPDRSRWAGVKKRH
jgi:hypothetical protein